MGVRWVLQDESGSDMRSTQEFASQPEAEEWLSQHWQDLAGEGASAVALRSEDGEIYEMSLADE